MKRGLLIGLVVLLALTGLYFGWRYYSDVYAPNRAILEGMEAQNALLAELKPDLDRLPEAEATDAAEPAGTDAEPAGADAETDLLAPLLAKNPDTVAWLRIDGTTVDYPIVQADDNERYLRLGFDRQYNYVGLPFLDYRCERGFTGFNSVVYGHDFPSRGEMFTDLVRFKDSAFLQAHPEGRLLLSDGVHRVRFFAYLNVPNGSFVYETWFPTQGDRERYLDRVFEAAVCTQGLTAPELKAMPGLRLLLLSTCSYEFTQARGVLLGVIE